MVSAHNAFSRFGLGARPGDRARVENDPLGALSEEIAGRDAAVLKGSGLQDSAAAYAAYWQDVANRKDRMKTPSPALPPVQNAPRPSANMETIPLVREVFRAEIRARVDRVLSVDIGFAERLTAFWMNHFAVESDRHNAVLAMAGAFEREAIRPHVLGRFEDMLVAVTRHPAMLIYLDNWFSYGPNSKAGREQGRGLNENLAREILELHTLGVEGGYDQEDVTAFARILTGWAVGLAADRPERYGRFVFQARRHEPGTHTVLGVAYDQAGVEQGEAVLRDLARNPATARHLSWKLARHFVADEPPEDLVEELTACFIETDGDLQEVALVLVESDAASAPATKLKTPQEFLWSSLRAFGDRMGPQQAVRILNALGQPIWNPPSPEGFSDDSADWLSPDGVVDRLDAAELLASRVRGQENPLAVLDDLFGPAASEHTRAMIARSESRRQGFALLLMCPEFLRR